MAPDPQVNEGRPYKTRNQADRRKPAALSGFQLDTSSSEDEAPLSNAPRAAISATPTSATLPGAKLTVLPATPAVLSSQSSAATGTSTATASATFVGSGNAASATATIPAAKDTAASAARPKARPFDAANGSTSRKLDVAASPAAKALRQLEMQRDKNNSQVDAAARVAKAASKSARPSHSAPAPPLASDGTSATKQASVRPASKVSSSTKQTSAKFPGRSLSTSTTGARQESSAPAAPAALAAPAAPGLTLTISDEEMGDDGVEPASGARPGDDADNPIDFTTSSGGKDITTLGHRRKDTSPEAALEAAVTVWEKAHQDEKQRLAAQAEGREFVREGKKPSAVYLQYSKPRIGKDKSGSSCIVFPCKCCPKPCDVSRPFAESSTSNLLSHVRSNAGKYEQQNLLKMLKKQQSSYTFKPLPPGVVRQLVVAWVTQCARPITIVQDEPLRALLPESQLSAIPSPTTIGRDIDRLYKGMISLISDEIGQTDGCIHLAIDIWTSANGHSFLGIIACYQKDGEAVRRLLEMVPFLERHDSVHLARATLAILRKYGLTHRLWCITSDNASENTSMMALLASSASLPRFNLGEDSGLSSRVRCMAHIVNLISKSILNSFLDATKKTKNATGKDDDLLLLDDEDDDDDWAEGPDDVNDDSMNGDDDEELNGGDNNLLDELDTDISIALNQGATRDAQDDAEIQQILNAAPAAPSASADAARQRREVELRSKEVGLILKKLAWLASKVRYSPVKRRMFQDDCERMKCKTPHTLLRDVATRWDSTFQMIKRGLELWAGIIAFTERADTPVPKDKRLKRSDEAELRHLFQLLKPLAKATKRFSKSKTPSIGEVVGMFEDLDAIFVDIETSGKEEAVWKEAARRGHLVCSKYYGLTGEADIYTLALLLHPNYRATYMRVAKWPAAWQDEAKLRLKDVFTQLYENNEQSSQPQYESQTDDFAKLDRLTKEMMRAAKEKSASAGPKDVIGEWLEGLTPLGADGQRVDPLKWWWAERCKGVEHSGLTSLALDVFSCPATSVEVERLFSRAGRQVTPLRHSLKAQKIAQLVTVGKWFSEGSVPQDQLLSLLEDEANARREKRKAKRASKQASTKRKADAVIGGPSASTEDGQPSVKRVRAEDDDADNDDDENDERFLLTGDQSDIESDDDMDLDDMDLDDE